MKGVTMAHPMSKQIAAANSARLDRITGGSSENHYARGGRTKKASHVTVNVMPQSAPEPQPIPVPLPPMGPAAAPPMLPRPPMPIPGGPGGPMGGPGGPGGPPMLPPGIRKSGGRAYKSGGAVKDGPAWKEGLRNGTQVTNGVGPRKWANGGPVKSEGMRIPSLKHGGGESGLGRLEKVAMHKKRG